VSQTTLQSVPVNVPRRYDSIYNVHFDVVHGCQLRCVGCPNSTLKPKIKTIDPDFFGTCLRNIDVQQIHTFRLFNFGEPLLHKQLHCSRPPAIHYSTSKSFIHSNRQNRKPKLVSNNFSMPGATMSPPVQADEPKVEQSELKQIARSSLRRGVQLNS